MYWCVLGALLGVLLILPKINEWKIMLSRDMIEFSRKRDRFHYFSQSLMLIGAAITEEIFFRNYVIGYIDNAPHTLSVMLSCGLFFLNHFGLKWNSQFSTYDYIIQIVFGTASSILFIMSKSILPSIIAHTIYNSQFVLLSVKTYIYHYIIVPNIEGENCEQSY
ncbi:CPBP family intramembrane glutamic endopeptidase [Clostridium thermarum]|uniref:CPBP family intramembrane glutamic endopeptidase n=1 Tax=Clostridium thermarum TaxID=1716543 RepID=UPI0013D34018|nr:CPBP family intramembrane glutamic endopeptidase [Clostridium thermarum]